MSNDLPPLPEADTWVDRLDEKTGDVVEAPVYPADQMRAYALQERAAERVRCAQELMQMHAEVAGLHNHYHFAANRLREAFACRLAK